MKTKDFGFKIQPNFTGIAEVSDGVDDTDDILPRLKNVGFSF
jgi:hypothetical protein